MTLKTKGKIINIAFFLLIFNLLFLSGPHVVSNAAASDLKFSEVALCNVIDAVVFSGDYRENICIYGQATPGELVTLLGENNDSLCHAKTGDKTTIVYPAGTEGGTRLIEFDCQHPDINAYVVINEPVKEYQRLILTPVTDSEFISSVKHQIKDSGILKQLTDTVVSEGDKEALSGDDPKIYKFPYPEKDVYFVEFHVGLVLIHGGKYSLLMDAARGTEVKENLMLMLNGRYFAAIGFCMSQGGGCATEYFEITKDSYKTF